MSHNPVSESAALATSDRRDAKRASIDLFMNRFLGGQPYLCVAQDVSRTGMRMRTLLGPHLPNQFVGLQFQLPGNDDVLTASGEVVREGEEELSIRFTHMPAACQTALERFLSAN